MIHLFKTMIRPEQVCLQFEEVAQVLLLIRRLNVWDSQVFNVIHSFIQKLMNQDNGFFFQFPTTASFSLLPTLFCPVN